jgi:hypothetical protein
LVIEVINDGLDVLDGLSLEDIDNFLDGVDLVIFVSNGFIKVANISVTLSNEVRKNTFNGSLLIGPFINIGFESSEIVSNADNFTVKSNQFNLSIFDIFSILNNCSFIISDSFWFSGNFSSGTFFLVVEEVINNFDNFGNELLISLIANVLSHMEENVVDGLSLVGGNSNKGSLVVLRELHEDVVIVLEEGRVLKLNNKSSSLLEGFNHIGVIILVLGKSSRGLIVDIVSVG